LANAGVRSTVLEASKVVGGISRTVEYKGYLFDIGGHRFFTKVSEVQAIWEELLTPDEFPMRPRLSRIYYRGKFFDYPIRPFNALRNLGPVEAARCVSSYLWAASRPTDVPETLEQYIVANYGRRLFEHFFKTYNEKVWGVPASALSAEWGAQRIKGMSLARAVWEPISRKAGPPRTGSGQVTSLIEQFHYPKLGPGMMWERCRDRLLELGTPVLTSSPVTGIRRDPLGVTAIRYSSGGASHWLEVDHVVSSLPLSHLVQLMQPAAPKPVVEASHSLRYRDFLTVALVIPEEQGFPDNWIYVHDPKVNVGRIQNFGSWSSDMVKPGWTCLGLEYFLSEASELWRMADEDLVRLAATELEALGLVDADAVSKGYVVRVPRAYPVYGSGYGDAVTAIRQWLANTVPNVHPVGRNGMHKYNNQDHSMLTAMLTAKNIASGSAYDVWSVNVEGDYHESSTPATMEDGTGRTAPVLPQPA